MLSTDTIYDKLTNDEDARACTDISDAACAETPRNFVLILVTQSLTKLGDAIANPKILLAWVMDAVAAPVAMIGLMVPIRESGSLIPQLVIASHVRRQPIRKWVFVAGAVIQGAAVGGIALAAVTLTGAVAGTAVLGALVVFSLARGLCSVASKDVLGKTIPKRRRGQLTGWSASAAGLVSIAIGLALALPGLDDRGTALFGALLAAAGLMWFAGALVYSRIEEFPGATEGGRNALSEALGRLELLRSDPAFRLFVIARALVLCSALSAPYFVLLGRDLAGTDAGLLGLFVVASGAASFVAAPVWGRYADLASHRVLAVAAATSAGIGCVVVAAVIFAPSLAGLALFMPVAYFVLSVAHSGVRVGRKTYVVDLASGNRRTDYVSVSNSVIGVVLLATGLIGTAAQWIGVPLIVLVLSLLGFAGALTAWRLPPAE